MEVPLEIEQLKKVAAGDEKAFRWLLGEYADFLHYFLMRLTGNHQLTQEIVQDIFLKIWQSRETLLSVRNFKAYLFIISRNYALKMIDKALTEKRRFEEYKRVELNREGEAFDEFRYSLIEEAVLQLPPQQSRVWILNRREGKKYAQIAAETGLSRETVKYYLKLATAAIRRYVAERLESLAFFLWFFTC